MEPQKNTDQDKSKQQRTPIKTADFVLGGSVLDRNRVHRRLIIC